MTRRTVVLTLAVGIVAALAQPAGATFPFPGGSSNPYDYTQLHITDGNCPKDAHSDLPANFDHPAHVVAAEVAGEAPFRDALGGHARSGRAVLRPEEYALLLERLGYAEQHVRLQVYGHRLAARDEVVEWVKGTLLTDYQRRLPAELYARFVARYRERLLPALEDTRPYFFTFKRVLLWAGGIQRRAG